jgi:inorganic pyrophosphatase
VSRSLALARSYLGWRVVVVMDRPLGSRHPRHGFLYEVNYGYIPGTLAPDGAPLDAYVLGVAVPLARAEGVAIAVIHRYDDDDDKLVLVPEGVTLSDAEIMAAVRFQERFFKTCIVRQGQSRA